MKGLNLIAPNHLTRVTDFIQEQIEIIARYANFAKLDLTGLKSGARVNFDPEKKNISDFALWKQSINENGKKRDME